MSYLTVRQLTEIVEGRLDLGRLPPLDGALSVVGTIRTDIRQVDVGNTYWAVDGEEHSGRECVDEAFVRGAEGVVAAGYRGSPWAGRWVVHVDDAEEALFTTAIAAASLGFDLGELTYLQAEAEYIEPKRPTICREVLAGAVTILDYSRNATADEWPDALEELREFPAFGQRWVVCGDLCGPRWDDGTMHRQLGFDAVRIGKADGLIACGQFAPDVVHGACHAGLPDSKAIACRHVHESMANLRQRLDPGDVVLVAGSRHLNMTIVVESIQRTDAEAA